ncbi:MAG: hypothetical protein GY714_22375 [Desulfobacterales bacterium]|nr:hypothetical protein [Desulfobacterales bacterium]MCP4164085.1 hypothetical protein [Deltaproteobacteria bacterium]
MKKIALLVLFLIPYTAYTEIGISVQVPIPQEALKLYIEHTVPVKLMRGDKNLRGDLFIESIKELEIKKGVINFVIHINGSNLLYIKELKNSVIKIKLKNLIVNFHVSAKLTFDTEQRVLLVKPRLTKKVVISDSKRVENHILQILSIMNNKEYPVKAKDLEPVIYRIINNKLNLSISNLYAKKKVIFVEMKF